MKEVALYIHIPFCKQKCFYCDFPSYARKDDLMSDYIEALLIELKEKIKAYKVRSLFIGGGTPSYLNEENLRKLMKVIKNINFIEDAEKTVSMFTTLGYHCILNYTKSREIYFLDEFHITIDKLDKLGSFAEFAIMTDDQSKLSLYADQLKHLAAKFGFTEKDLEKNNYKTLMLNNLKS